MSEVVSYEVRGSIGLIQINNPPVNALSVNKGVLQGLLDAIKSGDHDPQVNAFLLIGGGKNFSGGADISEFGKPKAPGMATLSDLLDYMDTVTKPIVAALSGPTMGGGFELSLTCHYRLASKEAIVGLPEVKLGILPGAGGTQRLPRIIGAEQALELITSGAFISAEKAKSLGIVNEIIDGELLEGSIKWIKRALRSELPVARVSERSVKTNADPEAFITKARAVAENKWRGYPAPLRIVECIDAAINKSFKEGMKIERENIEALIPTDESKSLRHLFFAERHANKVDGISKEVPIAKIQSVSVIGAGTMGTGIAMNFLNVGIPVTIIDTNDETLQKGIDTIKKNYLSTVEKGRLSAEDRDRRVALLQGSTALSSVSESDLVVEAVFEEMAVKKAIFLELDSVAKPSAILATNTSTLDVNEIALVTKRPEQVIGLHFFSPANVMQLLEVVRADKTSKEVVATSMSLAKKIKKIPVCVGVCDGFVGNRMIHTYLREAEYLIEEGALPQQVDHAIESFGFAMGPFRMCDLAGLDIGWAIRKRRKSEGLVSKRYVSIPDQLCERGWFGQKTGSGYYTYESGSRVPIVNPEVNAIVENASSEKGITRRTIEANEIVDRLMYALINEGAGILAEGVAQRASDIDVIYAAGYGFPRYRGGPMFYAQTIGLSNVVEGIERYSNQAHGEHWQVSAFLSDLVQKNETFE
ncbi:MAG: 3-hydroxyacyl-CoA dehydrogenase NAD-binding domain-containing protein [Proteobacteria bacterium]|nr:3-hydroxyacyl-CoA dehydrogenase NAD-binding domain-containing protein [Pseudomonadota bacterium]MDA0862933.1 3-hydroxyacyl-CoA dehydrogenase NAD-binding domain-containing protein [Pseudomonadota bacterium]MDA1030823.1 3-hydroxyacyl-CoA dehydrogenase NAD-binding domain-containing protein [Pseudomonadota bacterium]